ncbi:hypothetical protein MAR_009773 [Mya arenaria]|uniref:VWFA domain-containing protein n=1 Tax=Mya arenaria TaxID=6604 RepID=A0ABY7DZP4_MYAAR|nr:hypothetical protein MAR_009773 [Mya arenaria]
MAFQFIIYDMFALNNGKRFNTDTNIIVLSDGESTYDSPPEANTLKEKGVTIFTIGTNIHSNLSFLQTLASSSKHHFSLYGRQDIDVIKDILAIAGIGYSLPVTEPDCCT